jgi:hypothetical protein
MRQLTVCTEHGTHVAQFTYIVDLACLPLHVNLRWLGKHH